jgi:hypothetical protein
MAGRSIKIKYKKMTHGISTPVIAEEFSAPVTEGGEVSIECCNISSVDGIEESTMLQAVITDVVFSNIENNIFQPLLKG